MTFEELTPTCFDIFRGSRTPCGLYARQKWLGEGGTEEWRRDFQQTVAELMEGQSADGSWGSSFIKTAQRLFGLHLTVRNQTEDIRKALDWMVAHALMESEEIIYIEMGDIQESSLEGLPFVPGDSYFLTHGIMLFLAAIFGRGNDRHVVDAYDRLAEKVSGGRDVLSRYDDMNNILRAFAVHPVYAESVATAMIVERLAEVQDEDGRWPEGVPFYQAMNALGHLASPQADRQLDRAFLLLSGMQNPDGTWGEAQKEWSTFLIVHALKNKKKL